MRVLFLIVFCFYTIFAYTQKNNDKLFTNCSLIIKDFLWISKTEVSNFQYREFINSFIKEAIYKDLLPDTLAWRKFIGFSEPYEMYYFRHPTYNNYPMVCISKENVNRYCHWLTDKINSELNDDPKNPVKKVMVRLPTEREWKHAAHGGLSKWNENPWEGSSLRMITGKNKGKFRLNFKRSSGDYMGISGSLNDMADITAPVKSYWSNGFGLYNITGNVSEMVEDNNFAYGGNWSSTGFNVKINSKIKTESSSLIGFRYVIEVAEWKSVKLNSKFKINSRLFKKLFSYINDTMSIMKSEVTNQLYNLYTSYTGNSRPDSTLWNDQFLYANQYTNKYHWHPDYFNYPVVNVSIQDVNKFIDWIQQQYYNINNEYVEIRLPNEEEWMNAARGEHKKLMYYPWGGDYIKNIKGDYLSNFRTYPEVYTNNNDEGNIVYQIPADGDVMMGAELDGFLITAPVKSYYSNDYGLYDLSGNVSEMIKDVNFTKGGSWKSEMEYIKINNRENYTGPDSGIGFRLIMVKK